MSLSTWFLDRLPLRQRLGEDPLLQDDPGDARFIPVPIKRLKITGNLRKEVLSKRLLDTEFSIDSTQRLAVIIPFRNREEHLATLLPALQRQFESQAIQYRVYVVDQAPGKLFNRARMINVGADLAAEHADYFCIHDVDMFPQNADYGCPSQPLRLVKKLTKTFRPVNAFSGFYFSGSISILKEQFYAANGFDNEYWGSGSQDEDFFYRCLLKGLVPHEDLQGVFGELDNPESEKNYRTRRIRRGNKRKMIWKCYLRTIGQSGMSDLSYQVLNLEEKGLVTRARVSV
jgi:predicted glycosyltransferase involved in capsule biosynthesis